MQNQHNTNVPIEEGAGKSALVGLAALAAMVLPASAKNFRSHQAARRPAPIVQNAVAKTYGGFRKSVAKNIVARTIYRESQGEGRDGMQMVATVIWQRANGRPEDMPAACKQKSVFSCWNDMTPAEWVPANFMTKEYGDEVWDYSKMLADMLINGKFTPLGTYTHYYANRGPNAIETPYWAVGARGKQLNNHIFFTREEIKRVEPMNRKRRGNKEGDC